MKKILSSGICAAVLLTSVSLCVSAETDYKGKNIPFEVTAPSDISLSWIGGEQDSMTTMQAAFSMNDSMCKWLSLNADPNTHDDTIEKLEKDCNLSDLWVTVQIDWAIDDPENGWHYTKYWDGETFTDNDGNIQWAGLGKDKDFNNRVGDWDIVDDSLIYAKTVNDCWMFRSNNINNDPGLSEEDKKTANEWFYGNDLIPGLKNQLKEDQYTLVEVDPETHDQTISIDWKEHTAYIRARWVVTAADMDSKRTPIFSDWSDTASYGKNAEVFTPYTSESLAPPVISDLKYYPDDFNGYPQVKCTLEVPDDLKNNLTKITANGGEIRVEWEARVPDGKWYNMQADETVTPGENIISLIFLAEGIIDENSEKDISTDNVVLEDGSPVELRARYWCNQYEKYNGEYIGEFYTDYSNVLTFGTKEMTKPDSSLSEEGSVISSSDNNDNKVDESKCSLCGFCPHPLGLCIFIWFAIIIVVAVVVIIVVLLIKKNNKKIRNNNIKI